MTYALILAGGIGSRFWPFSRELEPKQFMKIIGDESLLQNTIHRLKNLVHPGNIYIVTNKTYYYELKNQIEKFHIPETNIILEPEGKNTAPAIGSFAKLIQDKDKEAVFITLPSDHYIHDRAGFKSTITKAIQPAIKGYLVTIGIKPRKPSTGYGYIKVIEKRKTKNEKQSYYLVEKFLEKPNPDKAKKYAASKDYFWNSGIFIWKASVFLGELKKYLPALNRQLQILKSREDIFKIWPKIKPISVDYGVLEHSKKIVLMPAEFDWTDLGSWDSLEDILPKDASGNLIQTDSFNHDSKNISVFSKGKRLICTIGLNDLIIADTPDALLVCDKKRAQEVKKIVDALKLSNRKENIIHTTEKRPWGSYTVLDVGSGFKIKLVEVNPNKRLSLQKHNSRAEHWVVVSGSAQVTHENRIKTVKSNQSIYIPKGAKHRIENRSSLPLKIVEVQTGSYLGEDDIERFEDDFKR